MPNVLPTIPNDPPQGIQALLDKVYLWNPDVSNELIEKINALLAKLGDAIGAIRPYNEMVAPINQYEPCYYGSGVYVASRELTEVPAEFNEVDWILIATKGVTAEEAAQTYLPLSGGTLTGPLSVDGHSLSATIDNTFQIQTKGQRYRYYFGSQLWAESLVAGGETALGVPNAPWGIGYVKKLNNGTDLTVPTEGGTLARVEDINAIGGVGTAGQVLTKTEDGMAWQDATGGSSLPDQTGNAGKFLTTDGTTASWGGDNLVQDNANFKGNGLAVGAGSVALASGSTAYGTNSQAKGQNAVAIGAYSETSGQGVAIGGNAKSTALRAIQLGGGTNSDANTFKVSNANGNFEMMDANGNIPLERLTYVTNQIGDISTALTAILGE